MSNSIPAVTGEVFQFQSSDIDFLIWNSESWITVRYHAWFSPCLMSRLNRQLFEKFIPTSPILWNVPITQSNFQKLILRLDSPIRTVFQRCKKNKKIKKFIRGKNRHSWKSGFFTYAMVPRGRTPLDNFFHCPVHSPW
jgi:hypothetical protein